MRCWFGMFLRAKGVWVARIEAVAKRFAETCEVRVYANEATLMREECGNRFKRSNATLVEVKSTSEAADEAILSDAYVLARDAADAGTAHELGVMVCTNDERLASALARARARGLYSIALSDFLRGKRNRPEFKSMFSAAMAREAEVRGMTTAYARALRAVASSAALFKKSKLANAAHQAIVWDPKRVFPVTSEELQVHNQAFNREPNEFGQPRAAPGAAVATLDAHGGIQPWNDDDDDAFNVSPR